MQPFGPRLNIAHAHSVCWHPSGAWLLAGDIGTDRVVVYAFDQTVGSLTRHTEKLVTAGGGARHIAMSTDGTRVYVDEEAGNRVHAWRFRAAAGDFCAIHPPLSTLREAVANQPSAVSVTAEVMLSPDETRLYVANRADLDSSIATYSVDGSTGALSLLGHTTVGRHPRHIVIDPSGSWLLSTALHDNEVEVFAIDGNGLPQSGRQMALAVEAPTHVLFLPPPPPPQGRRPGALVAKM